MAINNASFPGIEGTKPAATCPRSGLAKIISIKKDIPIIPTRAIIKASILRIPSRCNKRKRNVSNTVISTPQINGKPVSN